ncbi:putative selection and upkeep of intraepithelial T-cells protein 1 homolog isoform X2 [Siniperca chuatsi]|uniref:putative selection and upkeep of intraepithelial T-cells protein 1 homolog isoform X2 n=1 Tax=Siniperca chuatsi TaxID=119488 RepID=UPI001CE204BA|nr:putative selection and upkeep of intraepithelial T-cells protein 1 homolog isoform X2 [Siniperca chuatsi]
MNVRLFLGAALWSCCAGGASGNSVSRKILASAGETVILPCHVNVSADIPADVEWSKEGLDPNIAFLYRDGCETYEMKNLVFQYRTNLFINELKNGNISLRISNVQLSDTGIYICKTLQRPPREVVTIELVVGAVSEPQLSVVPAVNDGVTLQCEANCWFPQPEITFLDEQGNNISAETPKSGVDSRGCYTVTRRVTVQTATKRVTCRVQQPHHINQTRVTDIYIPANCMTSCTLTTSIAVVVTAIICALIGFLFKKCGNFVGGKKITITKYNTQKCRSLHTKKPG